MRKIHAGILLATLGLQMGFSTLSVSAALDFGASKVNTSEEVKNESIVKLPAGAEFVRLQNILDTKFTKQKQRGYNSFGRGYYTPNYRYTSIDEKTIKLIILSTYEKHKDFYKTFVRGQNPDIFTDAESASVDMTLNALLAQVPRGESPTPWFTFGSGNRSVGGALLDASFGVDFSEGSQQSGMLGTIEAKIQEMAREKCGEDGANGGSYSAYCRADTTVNMYLPTREELFAETIYLNRGSVKIKSLQDEFEYIVQPAQVQYIKQSPTGSGAGGGYTTQKTAGSYTLSYKKNSYTLTEAKAILEGSSDIPKDQVITGRDGITFSCGSSKECGLLKMRLGHLNTLLQTHYADRNEYPKSLSDPNLKNYITDTALFTEIEKYFSYKVIKTAEGRSDFELTYRGNFVPQEDEKAKKKDYTALLSGATIPAIPEIFSLVPADSMALYIRDPANLLDILSQKSDTTARLSGVDVSETIQDFVREFFEIEDFSQIEKNLKHELMVVVNNLDATAPDIVLILSSEDRAALAPTGKARVVGSQNGHIYIANSKASLDRVMNLDSSASMRSAPDFQYVWQKKSDRIKDAFLFVGDAFFEKMLTIESYIPHYRKYRDVSRLTQLQELVWAYSDLYDRTPSDLTELSRLGFSTLSGSTLSEYQIDTRGIVSHKNIGSLQSLRDLTESNYTLDSITRHELNDYRENILEYREVWQTALDPMGLILNRYKDGMEIDFFMTPIPELDSGLSQLRNIFEGSAKTSLDFMTNPHIRMGIFSSVLGIDLEKLREKSAANTKKTDQYDIIQEIDGEIKDRILGGKSITDYLGGEIGLTLGSIDPDIFEGWNIEKIDLALSVQMKSEEKGKELIKLLQKKMVESADDNDLQFLSLVAKPLIEDYGEKKIYYVENIPFPFVGKIGIAYTFVDDFLVIGLNRPTIKKTIDAMTTTSETKSQLIDQTSFSSGSFLGVVFDGESASREIAGLYQKNEQGIIRESGYFNNLDILQMVGPLWASRDRQIRLGETPLDTPHHLMGISLLTTDAGYLVTLDTPAVSTLTKSRYDGESVYSGSQLTPYAGLYDTRGVSIDTLIQDEDMSTLLLQEHMRSYLGRVFVSDSSLFRNMTFGLSMEDDIVGFTFRVFRGESSSINDTNILGLGNLKESSLIMWIVLGITGVMILGGGGFLFWKRRGQYHTPHFSTQSEMLQTPSSSPVGAPAPLMTPVSGVLVMESPSTPPLPSDPIISVAPSPAPMSMIPTESPTPSTTPDTGVQK